MLVEGKIRFFATTGKISKKLPVFYNPKMKANRDLTVLATYFLEYKDNTFLDLLAGSGIRGIRAKIEGNASFLVFNDIRKDCVEMIKKNLELNSLEGKVYNKDANALLFDLNERFDFIDLDPFGSPVRFLDAVANATRHKGIVSVTATDLGALGGKYPKTSLRRYFTKVFSTDISKEVVVRNLLSFVARTFAKYKRGIYPLFSIVDEHYAKIIFKVYRGRSYANEALENLGYMHYNGKERFFSQSCVNGNYLFPLWVGKIGDSNFCRDALGIVEERELLVEKKVVKWLEIGKSYFDYSFIPSHNFHAIQKKENIIQTKKIAELLTSLRKDGFLGARSVLDPDYFITNASYEKILKEIRKL